MDSRGRATALQRPQTRRRLRRLLWSTRHGRRRWTAMTPSIRHAHAPALARIWADGCLLLPALSSCHTSVQPQSGESASAVIA